MENFLNAAQMKNHTDEFTIAAIEKELKELYELMYKSKQYNIKVSDLSWGARDFLKNKGYKINHYSDQKEGENYFIISWK